MSKGSKSFKNEQRSIKMSSENNQFTFTLGS